MAVMPLPAEEGPRYTSARLLRDFAERNLWNATRLAQAAAGVDPALLAAPARGSYGSIHETLAHVTGALDIWLRRLHGESPTRQLSVLELPTVAACAQHLAVLTEAYAALLDRIDDAALARQVTYRNTAGEPRGMLAGEILLHVCSHTSDHLAQVATLLTQAGVEPPGLDFMEWALTRRATAAPVVDPAAPASPVPPGLSPDAQRFQDEMTSRGHDIQVREMPASTRSAAEAAAAIGCEVDQIAKSLVFRTERSGDPILVIASGPNRVSLDRLAALLYEPVNLADAEFVLRHTGYAIGGVPPLAHLNPIVTLIDQDLMAHETIWAAAGSPFAVFSLTPAQLLEMTAGRVVGIT